MLHIKIYGVTCLEQVGASLEFMYPGENNEFQGRFQKIRTFCEKREGKILM